MDAKGFVEFSEQYKNWGRWGDDDEAGTLNFITPERIVEACSVVRKGRVFALAIPFDRNGPQINPQSKRFNPIHTMLRSGLDAPGMTSGNPPMFHSTDDAVHMPLQSATQWDALSHVVFQGKMYNNRPASLVDGNGAQKNSIMSYRERMIGRGVLLDLARHRGAEWVEPGEGISVEELEDCRARQGVEVKEGDFVLIRTGSVGRHRRQGTWDGFSNGPWPGLDYTCIPWLHEKRIAALVSDCVAVEVRPFGIDGVDLPVHCVCLVNLGMPLGEIVDLEDLAADCAEDGVYEFLFVAPPLPVTNAVGSPINPYAVK